MTQRRWADFPVGSLWALCYLGFLYFQPAYVPTPWGWPLAVGIAVVFAALYIETEWHAGPVRRWSHVLTTVFAVAVVMFNSGASVLFVFAAVFAGSYLARRTAIQWFSGLTFLCVAAGVLSAITNPYAAFSFVPALIFIWVVGFACANGARQEREAVGLRLQNARIEHLATVAERERISRDLHDLLGHTLTGIVVRSQLAQRLARVDVERGVAEMAEIEEAARGALAEVRATVSGWRHIDLDDELTAARGALAAVDVSLVVDRDPALVLTPSAATALGLALREAVTNVVRHAGASTCTVVLRRAGDRVVLEVVDDGVGGSGPEGNGLTGMRERIGALGGDVQRLARDGTALTVAVPSAVAT